MLCRLLLPFHLSIHRWECWVRKGKERAETAQSQTLVNFKCVIGNGCTQKEKKKCSHKSTFCDGNFFQSVVEWNLFSVNNKCREITAGGCVRISFRGSLQSMRAIIAPASVRRHNFSAKRADDLRRQRAKRIVVQNANLLHLLTASLSLIIYSGRSQIFPIRNGSLSAGDPSHHPEHENCLQIKSRSPSSIKAIKTTSRYQYGRQ